MKITYTTADTWTTKKTTLNAPVWEREPGSAFERYQVQPGISLQAVYWQSRNRRLIAQTYSIWDDGRGCQKGTRYHEVPLEEVSAFARVHHTLEDVLVQLGFAAQILNY